MLQLSVRATLVILSTAIATATAGAAPGGRSLDARLVDARHDPEEALVDLVGRPRVADAVLGHLEP